MRVSINEKQYMIVLTIVLCIRVAYAAMTFVIRHAAIIEPLDSSNNHADWPIPAARSIWELVAPISSGGGLLVHLIRCERIYGAVWRQYENGMLE
ncbi:MAG: hypothetical protein JNM45_07170 [Rhizobiales bacterium]|nr:hypothetical protein [Hyphomicrobiales bacterium]